MSQRFAFCTFLLLVTAGCGQSSSSGSNTSPTAPSATSAQSTPSAACTFVLSVGSTINGYPNGGSFTVTVRTTPASSCNWTATSQVSWIHVPSGASGGGTGSFTFSVDANPGEARGGTLTVAGQLVAFNQSSGGTGRQACVYSLSIGSFINGYPTGGSFRASVKTASACTWTVTSNADWIQVTSGASGKGDGAFTFVVNANTGPARVGTLVAAGEVVVFNQSS